MDILDLEHQFLETQALETQALSACASAPKTDPDSAPETDGENEYDLVTLNYLVLLDAMREGRPARSRRRRA